MNFPEAKKPEESENEKKTPPTSREEIQHSGSERQPSRASQLNYGGKATENASEAEDKGNLPRQHTTNPSIAAEKHTRAAPRIRFEDRDKPTSPPTPREDQASKQARAHPATRRSGVPGGRRGLPGDGEGEGLGGRTRGAGGGVRDEAERGWRRREVGRSGRRFCWSGTVAPGRVCWAG